jgi:hypothetical protein
MPISGRSSQRYLTAKRAAFLKHFATYPYITTEQAYLLASADTDSARRGLRRFLLLLHKSGYVLREPVLADRVSPFPHCQFSYRLSKHGAAVIHGRATAEKSPYSLLHDQEITRFHLELRRQWNDGQLYWQQRDLKRSVYPDALFALSRDGKVAHYFFLEIEKSRQGHYRGGESGLDAKIARYARYRKTATCKREWLYFEDFRIAIVVKNEERRQNLLGKVAHTSPYRFIWVTTEDLCRANILGSIFLTPKDFGERSYSLADVCIQR